MDRTERFYKIELLIRNRRAEQGLVSFTELMDELGVSRATLKRDLEYLRSRMDAPIVYDRFHNGYRFEAPARGGAAEASHELPGVWFSEREIHALLTMHQLIQGLDEGGVLARHLQPLLDKLHRMLGTSESDARELMKRIRIASPARRAVSPRHFELLGSAITLRRQAVLDYYVRTRQQASQRTVSPQRLVFYRNTWYLDAWCHSSDGLRRFAVDAVRDARLLDTRAKDVALKTVEAALDGGYGVFGGTALRQATLLFTPEAAEWVAHEQWHPQQRGERLADGSYRLELPYTDPTELAMDVLRHGGDVQVLGDDVLKARVRRALEGAVAAMGGRIEGAA
ncbi:WYL domain-containing protein [Aquincola sp. MAHUQ-54]|uniref:WYL domain-containing protein n=1 Tax=Aquincola agrisoli TaxID=3119538 RepID=A0AAW9QGL4_9BURK